MPIWIPLAAAGVAAAGGVAGAAINSGAQAAANQANIDLAKQQNRFQLEMSTSAYQRATADMRRAGINPMLAYMQGGAQGGSPSLAQVDSTRPGDAISSGVSSGLNAFQAAIDANVKESQVQLQGTQALAQLADAQVKEASAKQVQQNTVNAKLEEAAMRAQLPATKAKAELEKAHTDVNKENVKYDNWRDRVEKTLGTVGSAIDAINPLRWLRGGSNLPSKGEAAKGKVIMRKDGSFMDLKTGKVWK